MLWYSLEVPHRGTSNEYPQHMFLWKYKKNMLIPLLSGYLSFLRKIFIDLDKSKVVPSADKLLGGLHV